MTETTLPFGEDVDLEPMVLEEIERINDRFRDITKGSRISDLATRNILLAYLQIANGLQWFLQSIREAKLEGRMHMNWIDARALLRASALHGQLLAPQVRIVLKRLKDDKTSFVGPFPKGTPEFLYQH